MKETWWLDQDELSEEQKGCVSLPVASSHLITGPPGSGKTNLLLLRANYLTLAGHPNILVVVFTRSLKEFIIAGANEYAFSASKVMTSRKWQQDFLYEHGVTKEAPINFDEARKFFTDEIGALVEKKNIGAIYEAILLDEAQDYLPEEIEFFKKLSGVLFVVADSRQKIYRGGDDSLETLRKHIDNVHELRIHYRCGHKICLLADAIVKNAGDYPELHPTCNYNESLRPSLVEHFRCTDINDQAKRIIDRLRSQLKAYPDELLGVVCPRTEEVSMIWQSIEKSDLEPLAMMHSGIDHAPFDSDKRIIVSSLHAAKGLEVRALHIAGTEFLKNFPLQRNLTFTAITRAKTSVSIYYADEVPAFLEQALKSLEPSPDLPSLKDTFGKGL